MKGEKRRIVGGGGGGGRPRHVFTATTQAIWTLIQSYTNVHTQALALGAPAAELKRAERTRRRRRRWWWGAETCIHGEMSIWAK